MNTNTNNRAIAGGCFGVLAFFFPWAASAFILGSSLFTLLGNSSFYGQPAWLELVCAVLLILGGTFALRKPRTAAFIILVSALLGFGILLQSFMYQVAYTAQHSTGGDQWGGFLLLGVGFWLAALGFIMAFTGGRAALKD